MSIRVNGKSVLLGVLLLAVMMMGMAAQVQAATSFHSDPFDSADAEGWWGSSKTGSSTYIYRTSASGGYFGFQGGDSCGSITLVTKDLDVNAFVDTYSLDIVIYSQTPSTGGPYNLWIYVTYVNGTTETLWDHMNYPSWTSLRTDTLTDLTLHGSQLANITVKLTSTTAVYSTSTKLYIDNFVLDTSTDGLRYSNVTLIDGDSLGSLFTIGSNTIRYYAGTSYLPMAENPTYFYVPASFGTQEIYVLTGADSYNRVHLDGELDPIFVVDSADEVTDYLCSIVDSSNTIVILDVLSVWALDGEGNAWLVDQDAIDYAKLSHQDICYSHPYFFAINSTEGTDYDYGLATITDNPVYLVFDLGTGSSEDDPTYNSTTLVPQTWNTSFTAGYEEPDAAADVWGVIAADADWGQWILLALPILFMVLAGAQYAFASGMIAASICAGINAAIGYAWYNTGILGWIAAVCLLMLVRDAMKQDHSIGGG